MKKQSKITIANMMTVLAAFATFMCLFAVNGISLQTVAALAAAYGCAYLTLCFFKVENILRRQKAAQVKRNRQKNTSQQLRVVHRESRQAA